MRPDVSQNGRVGSLKDLSFQRNTKKLNENCQNQLCQNSGMWSKIYSNQENTESRKKHLKCFNLALPHPLPTEQRVFWPAAHVPGVDTWFWREGVGALFPGNCVCLLSSVCGFSEGLTQHTAFCSPDSELSQGKSAAKGR